MLFQSIEFLIFLPIVFLLYWFVFKKLKVQNALVLVASYVFYGWWDWRFLILIAITSGFSYWSGLLIKSNEDKPKAQKWICAGNIILNLLILFAFKYLNFFSESLVALFALFGIHLDWVTLKIILPVGISFYTFQALSYTIDVYRKKIEPTRDIVAFFAFISFFPQLVAGPIERATNLLPQFLKPRKFDYATAVDGCRQMLWGFFKKVVVADNCAVYVNEVFESYQSQSGSTLALALILFAFQLYCDFSGYSDIAIGTAKLFGINLMRNFNYPYFATSFSDYWKRNHISLTTWFMDYVYYPMIGGSDRLWYWNLCMIVTFLLSGLWHGASWTFVAWGLYQGVFIVISMNLGKRRKKFEKKHKLKNNMAYEFLCMFVTFFIVCIGLVLFRAESIGQAWEYVCGMMQFGTLKAVYRFFLPNRLLCWPTNLFIIIMLVVEWVSRNKQHGLNLQKVKPSIVRYLIYYAILTFIILNFGTKQAFIYFQF
ncbi:MAG: MBOAT family O-acyltransferase [Bacteroidia bacterium]|nr:MBOAT family O-acyltransferase [Bacteroidia bacterium]